MTDKLRTGDTLTDEYHEALEKLGISRYTLVAHSISGLHGLSFTDQYPDEVAAFVGIDTTTPGMDKLITPDLMEATSTPDDAPPHSVKDDISDILGYTYSPSERERMEALLILNGKNDDKFEAIKKQNGGAKLKKPYESLQFPDKTPTVFLLSTESSGLAPWYEGEHEKQLTHAPGSRVEILDGGHFLHHNQAATIARAIKAVCQA